MRRVGRLLFLCGWRKVEKGTDGNGSNLRRSAPKVRQSIARGVSPWSRWPTTRASPKGATESRTCGTVCVAPVGLGSVPFTCLPRLTPLGY